MTVHSKTERRRIVAAIHEYGRARAAADYTLGTTSKEEFLKGVTRVTAAANRVDSALAAAIPTTVTASAAFSTIADFGAALFAYGSLRRDGENADAAADVLESLDEVLALGSAVSA